MNWIDKIKIWFKTLKYGLKRYPAKKVIGNATFYTEKPMYEGQMMYRKDVEVIPDPHPSEYTMKQVGGIEKLSSNAYVLGTYELYKDGNPIDYHGIPMPQMNEPEQRVGVNECKIGDWTIKELSDSCSIEEYNDWAQPYKGTTTITNLFFGNITLNPDKWMCNKKQMTKEEMAEALWGEWEVENKDNWIKGRRHVSSMQLNKKGICQIELI